MSAARSPSAGAVSFSAVLANRGFRRLWAANLVSQLGDWLAVVALFSRVAFERHGSPTEVSGILAAFLLPHALLGPLAGVLVDRFNPRATMVAADLVSALLVAALAVTVGLPPTYALVTALSVASAFFVPAHNVAVPHLVEREQLLVANALNAQTAHLTKVLGPALGGLLVTALGERACFVLDAISFVASAALLSRLPLHRDPAAGRRGAGALLRDLADGLRFAFRHTTVLFIGIALGAAAVTLGAFNALVSLYVREVLSGGARDFGLLVSTLGAGTIAGAFLVGRFAQRVPRARLASLAMLALGAGLFAFTATDSVTAALGWGLAMGLAAAGIFVPSQTLMQEETPKSMLGRVSSTLVSATTLAQLIGIVVAGALAEKAGLRGLFRLAAAGLAATGVLAYGWARARRVGEGPTSPDRGGPAATALAGE